MTTQRTAAAYNESYWMETPEGTYQVHVIPGTDLEGTFVALEEDSGEFIRINGWTCTFELCKEQPRAE